MRHTTALLAFAATAIAFDMPSLRQDGLERRASHSGIAVTTQTSTGSVPLAPSSTVGAEENLRTGAADVDVTLGVSVPGAGSSGADDMTSRHYYIGYLITCVAALVGTGAYVL
ncbi:hypothetical protein B0T17DRAFT_614054 [Bombardia bombarda]|uniref:Uncharacterized protein n=1 Tax=Bombardia bombarda TaxID=252184 RepID=A0AA39XPR3_9PEZI|nr:hypothetical protein B0T17DRAFT_614054 [Bombardia bombarda]